MAPRLEKYRPEDLTAEQKAIYDTIVFGPRASAPQLFPMTDSEGRLEGPFNAWLINPVLGNALEIMGSAYHAGMKFFTPRAREIAILIIAANYNSAFELYAHERVGKNAGLSEMEITTLSKGGSVTFEDEIEQAVADTTRLLLEHHDLDDDQFERIMGYLGLQGTHALVWLTSWYAMLALSLNVFRVEPQVD